MRTLEKETRARGAVLRRAAVLAAIFLTLTVAPRQALARAPAPAAPGPWEVTFFEFPDWLGESVTYRLEPGMRHLLVAQLPAEWNDRFSSVMVGANVKVHVWEGIGFTETDRDIASSRKALSEPALEVNDEISSVIVYPRAVTSSLPLGLVMYNADYWGVSKFQFFPLPPSESETEYCYELLGGLEDDANRIVLADINVGFTLYDERNCTGASLTVPGPTAVGLSYTLDDYQWSDRAASLAIRWLGQPLNAGPPPPPEFETQYGVDIPGMNIKRLSVEGGPEDCIRACLEDPNCKAFTWVKAGVQAPQAQCWLKSGVPAAVASTNCASGWIKGLKPADQGPTVVNVVPGIAGKLQLATPAIAGKWRSSAGYNCIVTQNGNAFTWTAKKVQQTGNGTLVGNNVNASWSDMNGSGSATGTVIRDAGGNAIRIEWSNGVVYTRMP